MDVAGLTISLIQLCGRLFDYTRSVKNAPSDVKRLAEELESLRPTLENVRSVLDRQQQCMVLQKLDTEITKCLQDLDSKVSAPSDGFRGEIKGFWRRFKWPLKENETREYILQIHRLQTSLVIELQAVEANRQAVERAQQQVERERQEAERKQQGLERENEERRRRGKLV